MVTVTWRGPAHSTKQRYSRTGVHLFLPFDLERMFGSTPPCTVLETYISKTMWFKNLDPDLRQHVRAVQPRKKEPSRICTFNHLFLRGKQLQYIYIQYIYVHTWNPNDPCFDNDYKKTCFCEGPTPKTKDKLIAGAYAIVYEYLERKVTLFFGGVDYWLSISWVKSSKICGPIWGSRHIDVYRYMHYTYTYLRLYIYYIYTLSTYKGNKSSHSLLPRSICLMTWTVYSASQRIAWIRDTWLDGKTRYPKWCVETIIWPYKHL